MGVVDRSGDLALGGGGSGSKDVAVCWVVVGGGGGGGGCGCGCGTRVGGGRENTSLAVGEGRCGGEDDMKNTRTWERVSFGFSSTGTGETGISFTVCGLPKGLPAFENERNEYSLVGI